MARSQKKNKRMGRAGRIVLAAFAALLLFILLLAGIGVVNASVVRVRKAEVILPDLPASFDGTRILYVSDIDLCGLNTAAKAGANTCQPPNTVCRHKFRIAVSTAFACVPVASLFLQHRASNNWWSTV